MDTYFDKIRRCAVMLKVSVSGGWASGSGVIYSTPNTCTYDYVLTAKHLLQENSQTDFDQSEIHNINVFYDDNGSFKPLVSLKKKDLASSIVTYDEDFAIIIIPKRTDLVIPTIIISDDLGEGMDFFSWGIFAANIERLNHFALERHDTMLKTFQSKIPYDHEHLPGISGSGVFRSNSAILQGIIKSYPNEDFANQTFDCTIITTETINDKLQRLGKVLLQTEESYFKKILGNEVVDIHQAIINHSMLDLRLAANRLQADMEDDWFYDPLKYIDLLQTGFLFKQFARYFNSNIYKASAAEKFYVPKKQYTLRQALYLPFVDRVMYMACVSVIAEKLDYAMIPQVYAARHSRSTEGPLILNGVEQWKKLRYQLFKCFHEKKDDKFLYGCVIEIDLLNFYENIDKELLNRKIRRICVTENEVRVAQLLHQMLQDMSTSSRGLPQNSDASALLASFYLNQVDTFMHLHCCEYYRFMDDVKIFCRDKYEARSILQLFEGELRRCYLTVNSQKTKILDLIDGPVSDDKKSISRNEYDEIFDLELNQIARYRKSSNAAFKNQAFHLCITVIEAAISSVDPGNIDDQTRRMNYALNTLAYLGRNGLQLKVSDHRLAAVLKEAVNSLFDNPWITPNVCKVLSLIPSKVFRDQYFAQIRDLVADNKFNNYPFQTYQLWMLLAKHNCDDKRLARFASEHIEANDSNRAPETGGMMIYLSSINSNYPRVMIRKSEERFSKKYLLNRIAQITTREFSPALFDNVKSLSKLSEAREFTHHFGHKDLIYVPGFDEEEGEEGSEDIEQLYSF